MEKFNPFNTSPLSDKLNLVKKETSETFYSFDENNKKIKVPISKFEDVDSGDEYIEKRIDIAPHRQNPAVEHFVSLLTKGILHSSDIIEKDGTYYSRKMNLENTDPARRGELEAEIFLLEYVFSDWDKLFLGDNVTKTEENKFAHYDYGEAFHGSWADATYSPDYPKDKLIKDIKWRLAVLPSYGEKESLKRSVINLLTALGFPVQPKMPEAKDELQKKSEALKEGLEDTAFWSAIIKKSKLNIMSDDFNFLKEKDPTERTEELRRFMIFRLDVLTDVLNKTNGN